MINSFKGVVAGALALAGATLATAEVQAMPIAPVASAPAAGEAQLDHVFYYGYGYRRGFYGYRRPFFGYRRFGYGYGYGFRRPFLGYRRGFYGYRRFY